MTETLEAYPSHPMQSIPYANLPIDKAIQALSRDVKTFWSMASLNAIADAFTMQRAKFGDSWKSVMETEVSFLEQLGWFIEGRFCPSASAEKLRGKRVRRYLCLGFFPNPKVNKKRPKRGENEPARKGRPPVEAGADEPEYLIGGSTSLQWFLDDRHICWRFTTSLGQYGLHPNSMIPHLIVSTFNHLLSDMQLSRVPHPLHSWGFAVWGKGKERTRKSLLPDALRYGCKDLETYADVTGMKVSELRELLVDHVIPEGKLWERDIFVGGWMETLQLGKTLEAKKLK
ncbi:hypothetical protein HDU67_000278 [Dinochytrium kinnereticum]|nr:hypothetical protein HDU67_000278 [Dinochytrium kinnereticum]